MIRPMPLIFQNNDRTLVEPGSTYDPPPGALPLLLFDEDIAKRSMAATGRWDGNCAHLRRWTSNSCWADMFK